MVMPSRCCSARISRRISTRKLGIEIGERLVHQADRRLGDDGAAERDALLLAAGELRGLAVEQRSSPRIRRRACSRASRSAAARRAPAGRTRCSRRPRDAETARRIWNTIETPRLAGGRLVTSGSPIRIVPGARGLEPGDQPQRRRFAAAGGPEQRAEGPLPHVEADADRRRAPPPQLLVTDRISTSANGTSKSLRAASLDGQCCMLRAIADKAKLIGLSLRPCDTDTPWASCGRPALLA